MAHCYYRFLGGENISFESELRMLREHGHPVVAWTRDNREIDRYGPVRRLALSARTVWDPSAYRELSDILVRERPAVAHFQNTFPLMSPSVYRACRRRGVAVVQTLPNYRLVCPNGLLFRDGHVCEDCVGRAVPWPGVVHACYRSSRPETAVVAAMLGFHHFAGTWHDEVDLFVVPSEFARERLLAAGIAPDRIVAKPNFIHPDPGFRDGPGGYALFAGRLTPEKGIRTLLDAWCRLPDVPLRIVGDGPLGDEVRRTISGRPSIEWLGERSHEETLRLIRDARIVVFPSEWYETFGLVAIEAFACGVPVVASRLGAMAEVVDDGVTGRLFRPGDAADLAATVGGLYSDEGRLAAIGRAARAAYEARYTSDRNYELLSAAYSLALEHAAAR